MPLGVGNVDKKRRENNGRKNERYMRGNELKKQGKWVQFVQSIVARELTVQKEEEGNVHLSRKHEQGRNSALLFICLKR